MIDLRAFAESFTARFDGTPRVFAAPGRVNLIGEHTDYNEGFVLPFAVDKSTFVGIAPGDGPGLNVYSRTLKKGAQIDPEATTQPRRKGWTDYVQGMASVLTSRGFEINAADILIDSEIPFGAGLSSSAALEVALGMALAAESGKKISPIDLATAGQRVEHDFAGVNSGIMDQMASALGLADHLILIDCRSLATRLVRFKPKGYELLVCDTKVKHNLASSEYNRRRHECEEGVRIIKEEFPRVNSLRDTKLEMLATVAGRMPSEINRRCRHVINENQRVLDAVAAIDGLDYLKLGELMYASHESLRHDYEVSCPELDLLVDTARDVPGIVGARMTGGGFGGCTINLIEENSVGAFIETVESKYKDVFGFGPAFLTVRPSNGAREIAVG